MPLIRWGLLFFALSLASFSAQAGDIIKTKDGTLELKDDPNPLLSTIGGAFGSVLVHETGHALTALSVGGSISAFRPYPHFSEGRLVGGSVSVTGVPENWRSVLVSIMGTGTNTLLVLGAAPMLPKITSPQQRYLLDSTLGYASLDFLGYMIWELLMDFKGDWHSIASHLDIPLFALLPLAVVNTVGLNAYLKKYRNEKPPASMIKPAAPRLSLPLLQYPDHHINLELGVGSIGASFSRRI